MESPVVFVLILATITFQAAPARTQTLKASENPLPVGSDVMLYTEANVTTGVWIFQNGVIVFIVSGQEVITQSYQNRVTLNNTNNFTSLTIKSVTVNDSGQYTLQLANSFQASLKLSVQEPISNVALMAKATNLVESNDTAVLTCSVSKGTSLTYVWINNSQVITSREGVEFSDGGAILTLDKVTRYDEGPFWCNVSNAVSAGISQPVNLNISYGPSNTALKIMPMKPAYKTGSNISISCSTESKPSAMIKWMFDGMDLNHSGSMLYLKNVTENKTGNYKCVFHNVVTLRFSSANAMIKIVESITAVMVNDKGEPAILHKSFSLYCDVTGAADKITWWKNGQPVLPDNTTELDMGNKTLTLNPVKLSDKGDYYCRAYNKVSNKTSSPYMLKVYYGPEKPVIMGPKYVKMGANVTLSCNASSNPPSSYKWYFNGSVVAYMSEYVTPPLTGNMSMKYTCVAFNNITGKNSTAYKMVSVIAPITDVKVKAAMKDAIEGYFYYLTCDVTGPAEYVHWMKDGELLKGDNRTMVHMDNNTLTFNPLEYNDTGYYKCVASNELWNKTSPAYKLLVYFGPKMTVIKGPAYGEEGKFVVFNCSAKSWPPSYYSWWYNGSKVGNSSLLEIGPLTFNSSGKYICLAYNNVTGKNDTKSKVLTVIEAVESVMIRNNTVPIQFKNFTLICEVIGPFDELYWTKDGIPLNYTYYYNSTHHNYTHHNYTHHNYTHHNYTHHYNTTYGNMYYYFENNTLTFTPVTTRNDGVYLCIIRNRAGLTTSPPYKLLVNYGPLTVTIKKITTIFGILVTLECSADSRPESEFTWYLNNNARPFDSGSTISFPSVANSEGNYTCQATNPVTGITMNQTKAYTVDHASALYIPSRGSVMLMGVFALSYTALFN
ncbi:carcinoembryonic antigen-related cell adhesion molecule 5-like [Antennarius striatus]|uniref:carcinoembryonic antigen-related cell adhesion molecule 5-like n=1 Tax=Antennarius striatus TaxID=241820 RepID=UPI0035B3DB98